jgi:hypothetical protein
VNRSSNALQSNVQIYSSMRILSNINNETFFEEQKNKPKLKKKLDGAAGNMAALQKLPFAQKVANCILSVVDSSNFAISDSTDSSVLFAIIVGPSPK